MADIATKIMVVDSGQIEARMVAWLAGEERSLEEFRNSDAGLDRDPYCLLADDIYGRKIIKEVDLEERFVGKVGKLGLGFGMAWEKFQHTLAVGAMGPPVTISDARAQRTVNVFRSRNTKIMRLHKWLQGALVAMLQGREVSLKDGLMVFGGDGDGNGYVTMPNGLCLRYPRLTAKWNEYRECHSDFEYWQGNYYTRIYGGLFAENITQCAARIAVAEQIAKIADHYRLLTMSHDEGVFLIPAAKRRAEKAMRFALKCFAEAPAWCSDLPVVGEGGYDYCYSK